MCDISQSILNLLPIKILYTGDITEGENSGKLIFVWPLGVRLLINSLAAYTCYFSCSTATGLYHNRENMSYFPYS